MRRLSVVLAAAMLALSIPAMVMAAEPPPNDTFENAEAVGSLPYVVSGLDTTAATTDATDEEANADCGAPATAASVWYSFTPTETAEYGVDVSASSYPAGVIVVTGEPGSFSLVWCAPGGVSFLGEAGTTYYLLVFSDDAAINGGTLEMSVAVVPPPPNIELSIDPVATLNRDGSVTLTGTVSCSSPADVSVSGELQQRAGRIYLTAYGDGMTWCEETATWSMTTYYANGILTGGHANVHVYAFAGGKGAASSYSPTASVAQEPGYAELYAIVRLHPAGGRLMK